MDYGLTGYSHSDFLVIAILLFILVAKLISLVKINLNIGVFKRIHFNYLLAIQPWRLPLMILLSFAVLYSLDRFVENQATYLYISIVTCLHFCRSILILWLTVLETKLLYRWMQKTIGQNRPTLREILPYTKNSFLFAILSLFLPYFIPDYFQTVAVEGVVNKISKVLMIWAIAWIFVQVVTALEKLTLKRYGDLSTENYQSRRIHTQMGVFKKMVLVFIFLIAVAFTFMVFEDIRKIGESILASAGLASVVIGFAAQRTLGNFVAGIQIAITQPFKINDSLVVQNEFGTIEDIKLTYVVLKIWDLRRLIIPINYFIENSFYNLTKSSANVLTPIIFFADYTLPVEIIRQEFQRILKQSCYWDGVVANLQVTDIKEGALQFRALTSARNSDDSWNLKCEVNEKLIAFIVENYPECLPRSRSIRIEESSDANLKKPIPAKEN